MMLILDKHKFAKQPKYHKSQEKYKQRQHNIAVYRDLTGNYKIPDEFGYWFLCAEQYNTPTSETNQILDNGLVNKNQIFGIDYDNEKKGIIDFNKSQHPGCHWYDGDWLNIINKNQDIFKPSFVHFDYTGTVVSNKAVQYLARTMDLCSPQKQSIIVAANLMLGDAHSSREFDPKILVHNIFKKLTWTEKWDVVSGFYRYRSSRVDLATIYFRKQVCSK